MEVAGQPGEFLVLEYLDGDRVYVPVQALHLVSRYTGAAPESAPLHKLGTDQWARARRRAAEQIRDVAAELLDLYARRKAQQGLRARGSASSTTRPSPTPFRSRKPKTRPRRSARCCADLASERPMDRIVCGDVGFGKTEVAMRAAFVAAQAGKQVAVLAPTTLLAAAAPDQLPRPLRRLAGAHRGAVALRQSRKETQAMLEGIEQGTVDIVIATHRLLHAARALQGPGADHRRRGAPLRRARQGAAAGAARRTCTCSRSPRRPSRARSTWRSAGCATCR